MGALGVGAGLLIGGTYWVLAREMREVFEDNLKQVALAVANHHGAYGADTPPRLAQQLPRIYEEYGKFEFVTAVWTRDGRRQHSSDQSVPLPFLSRSGLSEIEAGGERWHLYTIVLEDGIVQAAQRASEREALARQTASGLILPALVLLAMIAWLLALALSRGLAQLSQATEEVSARSAESLHPIALTEHPPELYPLIGAINDMMTRLGGALALQRHFLADAAHELRTPITALRLQLQLLERAATQEERENATAQLRAGIERAQHLVEQLLQLSRLAPETPALRREPADLSELVRTTVASFSARADHRHIDLGAVAGPRTDIAGDAHHVAILINNLVDNALRHTPVGGRVDVSAALVDGRAQVSVTDTGPGIPPGERERVFHRFFRSSRADGETGNGSGLGLAIVKAVAERHGADIVLEDAPAGRGLRVTVRFPAP
ncbi:MAG: HAMP domain-containing sensor histidine kinase [Ramlibacter sp.]